MGLFADIQQQVIQERRETHLQNEQAEVVGKAHQNPLIQTQTVACPTNDGAVVAASIQRIKADTERITRRNMKDAVAAFLTDHCSNAPTFAQAVMQPQKNMVKCFAYINRKAREYAEQERQDNNITDAGIYGCDIPDDLCYQWAIDYFMDPDSDKVMEKKLPQKSTTKQKSKTEKNDTTQSSEDGGQMTLLGEAV